MRCSEHPHPMSGWFWRERGTAPLGDQQLSSAGLFMATQQTCGTRPVLGCFHWDTWQNIPQSQKGFMELKLGQLGYLVQVALCREER